MAYTPFSGFPVFVCNIYSFSQKWSSQFCTLITCFMCLTVKKVPFHVFFGHACVQYLPEYPPPPILCKTNLEKLLGNAVLMETKADVHALGKPYLRKGSILKPLAEIGAGSHLHELDQNLILPKSQRLD